MQTHTHMEKEGLGWWYILENTIIDFVFIQETFKCVPEWRKQLSVFRAANLSFNCFL